MRSLVLGLLLGGPSVAMAGPLSLTWSFMGIEEGYDHLNKMAVYVNGELVGESPEALQSSPKQQLTVDVPDDGFTLRVVNMAFYGGVWEEHTVANNYSIDCAFERSIPARKKHKFKVLMDLDGQMSVKGR
jgi:hypothetical protein